MPRVDPWVDGAFRRWEDQEFYKAGTPSAKIIPATGTADWVGPIVVAAETMLFVVGPEGIVLSAILGLAFAALQPSKLSRYNQNTRENILAAVQDGLRSGDIKKAINDLRDFQEDLKTLQAMTNTMSSDDFRALDTTLDNLSRSTQSGGSLQHAFDTLRDGVQLDGHDHGNELQWLVAAVLCIFQAYWIRCTAYAHMARYHRRQNNFHEYNARLGALRIAYEGCQAHLPDLLKQTEGHIHWARQDRINSISIEFDHFDTAWYDRAFGSADKESVRERVFIKDNKTGQRLEVAGLVGRSGGRDYSDGMGNKSDDNDRELGEFGNLNKPDYIKHLGTRLDRDIQPARSAWNKLQGLFSDFITQNKPATPQFPPVRVGKVRMGIKGRVPVGSHLSYRVIIVNDKGVPITGSSPWSAWFKITSDQTEVAQFLIGDGYAMTDTHRQIWMRVRPPSMPLFQLDNEQGALVDTIYGHGLILWPETSDEGAI
ncbi:unnamed protein product [Mycena citricolor]|uniref:Uncharacterized protein n=1 Tax=Mycena citricolor TaxID=2018698 RepID=A0AAD2HI44_9AGAR|nr:unnamed protein product [Mycena citricolor]CAK5276313.1 unnamed protein product [Mycena citricolor]